MLCFAILGPVRVHTAHRSVELRGPFQRTLLATLLVNAGRPVVVTAAHRAWIYPDTAAFPEQIGRAHV